ncbi:hypothetical protein DFH06DRAFT_1175936 [Mycena polygramma]|nr:hypothetical protein DFH06DRAFT_1175936 [Mycena polygramma]
MPRRPRAAASEDDSVDGRIQEAIVAAVYESQPAQFVAIPSAWYGKVSARDPALRDLGMKFLTCQLNTLITARAVNNRADTTMHGLVRAQLVSRTTLLHLLLRARIYHGENGLNSERPPHFLCAYLGAAFLEPTCDNGRLQSFVFATWGPVVEAACAQYLELKAKRTDEATQKARVGETKRKVLKIMNSALSPDVDPIFSPSEWEPAHHMWRSANIYTLQE